MAYVRRPQDETPPSSFFLPRCTPRHMLVFRLAVNGSLGFYLPTVILSPWSQLLPLLRELSQRALPLLRLAPACFWAQFFFIYCRKPVKCLGKALAGLSSRDFS